jgi:Ser/Thr protein kinase RdoA (MazF antagonist)
MLRPDRRETRQSGEVEQRILGEIGHDTRLLLNRGTAHNLARFGGRPQRPPPYRSEEFHRVSAHPYAALTPDVILDAVETYGLRCTGALQALNSYENRVYRVGIEEHHDAQGHASGAGGTTPGMEEVEQRMEQLPRTPAATQVAAKFYRPARWSDAAIREEHAFALELAAAEIPVVAPLAHAGDTLASHAGFRFALFPWQPGRVAELNRREEREVLGRYLGRLHRVGRARRFQHRPALTVEGYGRESAEFLRAGDFLPDYLAGSYRALTDQLLDLIDARFAAVAPATLRLHGDCHLSNLLWTDGAPHLVDLDDCRSGPAVQDLWMLLSGSHAEREQQLGEVLAGYTQFMEFDPAELALVEPLRTLRLMHYSAWLARRWDDPAFPVNFPWFNTTRYWEEQLQYLREQLAALDEPALAWRPD